MKTQKETRKVANSGNFIHRIRENISNGWDYPNAIISVSQSHARHKFVSRIEYYFLCKDNKITFLLSAPISITNGLAKDYQNQLDSLNLPCYGVQQFITARS